MSVGVLVLYRRHTGEHQVFEYPAPDGHSYALQQRLRLDADPRFELANIEICALSSDSLDSIKVTHPRYFSGTAVDLLAQYGIEHPCPDCDHRTFGYGAPPRSCDKHWQEDHPHGMRASIPVTFSYINHDLLRQLFAQTSQERGKRP